jgi:hypothetical protein
VQDRCGNDVVRIAGAIEERRHLDWVQHELGMVGRAMLTGVALRGESHGRLRQGQMVGEGEVRIVVDLHGYLTT